MLLIYASYFWMEKGAKHCTSLSHSWRFQLFSSCSSSRSQSAAPLSVKGCMEIQHAPGLVHRWRSCHAPMAGKKQFRMAVLQSCGEKVCFAPLVTWKISKILPRGWWMNLWSGQKNQTSAPPPWTFGFWHSASPRCRIWDVVARRTARPSAHGFRGAGSTQALPTNHLKVWKYCPCKLIIYHVIISL